jgi:hypothetical protein
MEERYLFKAKRIDWREFPEKEQWIIGYYVLGFDVYEQPVHLIFEPTTIFYSSGETDGWSEVDPSTICQCTGLKDENDKLIWENDIIRCKVGTAKVIWDKSEWRIEWLKNDLWRKDLYYWAVEDIQRTVVIGNIFDNEELLESEE